MVEQIEQQKHLSEDKLQEIHQEKEKNKTEQTLKIFAVVISIFLEIALFVIKINNPTFSTVWFVVLFIVIAVVGLLVYFSFNFFKKFNKEKEEKVVKGLPKPLSYATLLEICEHALTNRHFANHTTGCIEHQYVHVGKKKERIFIYKTKALYSENMEKGIIYILVNTHDVELKTILIDPSIQEIIRAAKSLASDPEDEPDVSESRIINPVTQTYVESREVKKHREEKAVEEKKEDL